jgi:hypothetical protein
VLVTAASGGSSLFDQYRPFAILKPKNRKKYKLEEVAVLLPLHVSYARTGEKGCGSASTVCLQARRGGSPTAAACL